jgi:hypothetical protein
MPTRIVREGIINSDRVNQLDWPSEVFYRRLLNKVDDHGLYDARPSVLRSSLYPLKVDRVREADCTRWLAECEKAGLIVLYQAHGKPFLKVLDTRWQTRSEPKYPLPPVNSCSQPETPVTVVVVEDVGVGEVKAKDAGASLAGFEIVWKTLPKRAGNNPKRKAESAYKARLAEKHTPVEMIDGAARYARYVRAAGKEGTEYVLQARTFLGPDKQFLQAWELPSAVNEWWKSDEATIAKGKELNLPARPGETMQDYRARLREALAARMH